MNIDDRFPLDDRHRLIDWYQQGHRDLPWRATRDPYRILVSEVMLQQTQAERVIPRYHDFLERFPTIQALADAPSSDVIRAWSGLGYNRRALNLQRTARAVVERHARRMPSDPAVLRDLPGIGPYTAGAIACFAFEQDVAFVDTNIRRVIHRVVAGPDVPEPRLSGRTIDEISRALVPAGKGYAWNQALMELGATICRARMTACERCPLQDICVARPVIQPLLADRPRAKAAQPKFETTSRYFRGRIMAALSASADSGLTLRELGPLVKVDFQPSDARWLRGLVDGLAHDGLVVRALTVHRGIAEPAPVYDAGSPDLDARFRLPD